MSLSDPRYLLFLAAVAAILPFIPAGRQRFAAVAFVSFVFYMGFHPSYALLLGYITIAAYVAGRILAPDLRDNSRAASAWRFISAIILLLAPLLDYKYTGLLARLLPGPAIESGPLLSAALLPVGISFYTFLAAGYVIDAYVGKVPAERDFVRFAAFMSFFPQLTAGPIERAGHLLPQLDRIGWFDQDQFVSGLRAILIGLFMKIVIADSLAPLVDGVYAKPYDHGAADLALATVYFSFQVYADFAGYSLIAIGSARILGIELLPNFAQPYLSQNLPEYWRTWHMTLSSWFRDYLFTPLQLYWRSSGKAGLVAALVVTFIVVGLWHGAGPRFALFGLIHGVLVSFSTLTFKARDKFWRDRVGVPDPVLFAGRALMTFAIVTLTFVIFRASSLADAGHILEVIFSGPYSGRSIQITLPALLIAVLIGGDLLARFGFVVPERFNVIQRWAMYHVAAVCILAALLDKYANGSPHVRQFIYFQF